MLKFKPINYDLGNLSRFEAVLLEKVAIRMQEKVSSALYAMGSNAKVEIYPELSKIQVNIERDDESTNAGEEEKEVVKKALREAMSEFPQDMIAARREAADE